MIVCKFTKDETALYASKSTMLYNKRRPEQNIGRGLFSKVAIYSGNHICNFVGNIFHFSELEKYVHQYKERDNYWGFIQIDKEHFLNTYENDCIANYINSPVNIHDSNGRKCVANAKLVVDHRNKLVRVIATKTIAAHSEILMSYGRKFKLN